MDARRALLILIALLFLIGLVDASANITLYDPVNGSNCVPGEMTSFTYLLSAPASYCDLYTNDSGSWDITQTVYAPVNQAYNHFNASLSPHSILWGVRCYMTVPNDFEYSNNFTFMRSNVSYCAVISEITCPSNVSLGSDEILKFRLGNTRGIWLENQDCNVWIQNSRGEAVKNFNTLSIMAQTSILLDKDGNWLNTAEKVPLTDSNGYYVYSFKVDPAWAWTGDIFSVYASCNGQIAICNFEVTQSRLPDVNNYSSLFKTAGGFIILAGITIIVLLAIWRHLRR